LWLCGKKNARPGAKMSLDGAKKKPDHLITTQEFDKEAVDAATNVSFPITTNAYCLKTEN
jgi:hypothetical protein